MRWLLTAAAIGGVMAGVVGCQEPDGAAPNPGDLPTSQFDGDTRVSASTFYAHGHLLERQGALEHAVEQYLKAIDASPEFPAAQNRLGIVLNKLGRNAEATQHFRAAIDAEPDKAYLYNNLGFSLFLENDYAGAKEAFANALLIQPDFPRARMNYAMASGKLGQFDDALQNFLQVCEEADAYYNVAVLQTDAGKYVDAVQSLDRALTANPNMEAARQQLRDIARLAAQIEAQAASAPTVDTETPTEITTAAAVMETEEAPIAPTPTINTTTTTETVAPTDAVPMENMTPEVEAETVPQLPTAQPQETTPVVEPTPTEAIDAIEMTDIAVSPRQTRRQTAMARLNRPETSTERYLRQIFGEVDSWLRTTTPSAIQ